MRGIVSFHPVDLSFFDRIVGPLAAGEKVNPEAWLDAARRVRTSEWQALRWKRSIEQRLSLLEPPAPPAEGSLWDKLRARLERFDHKPDPLAAALARRIEPDLHLHGRPFLVTEGSADRVAGLVEEFAAADSERAADDLVLEQLVRLDATLGGKVEPVELGDPTPPAAYRGDLLARLREIYDLAEAARRGERWGGSGDGRALATEVLPRELPWRAVDLHARAVPFWIGRDVDGLETVCRAAGLEPPAVLAPAWRPFAAVIESFPAVRERLASELAGPRDVGAYVAVGDVGKLLDFLTAEGAKIIQIATRAGAGAACAALLKKIRECATFASRRGLGYLEASGVLPPGHESLAEGDDGLAPDEAF